MTEHAPSSPEPDDHDPEGLGADDQADLDRIGQALTAPETDSAINAHANAILTRTVGERVQRLTENEATWRIKALNRLDRAQLGVRTLHSRHHLDEKYAETQNALAAAAPGSRKHRSLSKRLAKQSWKRGVLAHAEQKIYDRIYDRSQSFAGELKKISDAEKTREEVRNEERAAVEMKRREAILRKYAKEMVKTQAQKDAMNPLQRAGSKLRRELYSDPRRRERLAKEIADWKRPANEPRVAGESGLERFKRKLDEQAQAKYNKRLDEIVNSVLNHRTV